MPTPTEPHLPDPITDYTRKRAHPRYRQKEDYIFEHHPGFNLIYWHRIQRAPERVRKRGLFYHWSAEQILITQALLISRMACVFIDHVIRRMDQTQILPDTPSAWQTEWENQYRHFITLFLRQTSIPSRNEIVQLMDQLRLYTRPSSALLQFRQRHWRLIERVLNARLASADAVAIEQRRFPTADTPPTHAARHLCFTAAVYADLQERRGHQPWGYAYSDCMLRRYEKIRPYPLILGAIIGFHINPLD